MHNLAPPSHPIRPHVGTHAGTPSTSAGSPPITGDYSPAQVLQLLAASAELAEYAESHLPERAAVVVLTSLCVLQRRLLARLRPVGTRVIGDPD